jgi:hypothetical protein
MSPRILQYFMWPYQHHFRKQMENRAEKALATLGSNISVQALLIGVRMPEILNDNPICIEPEDGEWDISAFQNVNERANEIFANHPDKHTVYIGDEKAMEELPESLYREACRQAVEEVLGRISRIKETHCFCGSAVRVKNFFVIPILQVSQSDINGFPQLSEPIKCQQYKSDTGLVQSLIKNLLSEACDNLEKREPGHQFFSFDLDNSGILRKAGRTLCDAIPLALNDFTSHEIFDHLNKISELRYEGSETRGQIIFVPLDFASVRTDIKFIEPIPLSSHKLIRKIVEISDDKLACIYTGFQGIVGFGHLLGHEDKYIFKAVFTGYFQWSLYANDILLMNCSFGIPYVPKTRLSEHAFYSNTRRILIGTTQPQLESLWKAVKSATNQSHGTMIVVSDEALSEAQRLKSQSIETEQIFLNSDLVIRISGIDGAILVDRNCNCHSIGVILDGIATDEGDSSRGARYNSALRYVNMKLSSDPPVPTICIVISEDGDINMIPHLRPQIKKKYIEEQIDSLRNLNTNTYHKVRLWLDENRFYLTSEQCERVNNELSRIESNSLASIILTFNIPTFEPNPKMNDSYYLDETEENILSPVITTIVKMVESLPDALQEQVADHIRIYIAELNNEKRWDTSFKKAQPNLTAAALKAKQEIEAGQSTPMDYKQP